MALINGVEIARQGLQALQAQQNVVGQNIANAATPGYSQRRVVVQPDGTGYFGPTIERLSDCFAAAQSRTAAAQAAQAQSESDALGNVQAQLDPLGANSLTAVWQGFASALAEVAKNPSESGVRAGAAAQGQQLAESVNQGQAILAGARAAINGSVATQVLQANRLLEALRGVNLQLYPETPGDKGGNSGLLDQRDKLLSDLSVIIKVGVSEDALGKVTVSVGGQTLLDHGTLTELQVVTSGDPPAASVQAYGEDAALRGGSLAGLVSARDGMLAELEAGYSEIRAFLTDPGAGGVNAVHASGYDLGGTVSGRPLFETAPDGSLRFNSEIAAAPDLLAAGATAASGDGDNARNVQAALDGELAGGKPVLDSLSGLYSKLGVRKAYADAALSSARDLQDAAQDQVDSVSGVSLDEQATRLMECQKAYQAVAKYLGIVDQMLETLLAIGGN